MLSLAKSWIDPIDPDEEDDEERDPNFDDDLLDELGYAQDDNGEWHRDDS